MYDRIIKKYFAPDTLGYRYYYPHCKAVTDLALKVAANNPQYNADLEYIENAGMLHDIGIVFTNAPDIGCFGDKPYLMHGFLGRELLEKEGLTEIAPICERHVGVGISKNEIIERNLPLPHRDMLPITIEEKIICYADKFYSKSAKDLTKPKSVEKIASKLKKHGQHKVDRFLEFVEMFQTIPG